MSLPETASARRRTTTTANATTNSPTRPDANDVKLPVRDRTASSTDIAGEPISSRYGSHALALGARSGAESVDTSLAGFAAVPDWIQNSTAKLPRDPNWPGSRPST